jgi:hypothetical protein
MIVGALRWGYACDLSGVVRYAVLLLDQVKHLSHRVRSTHT